MRWLGEGDRSASCCSAEDLPSIERLEGVAKIQVVVWKDFLMAMHLELRARCCKDSLSVAGNWTRTHFCHLSTRQSIVNVRSAK